MAEGPLSSHLDRLGVPIAIVGTRRPSPEAVEFTRRLAGTLAHAGHVIVSGGAVGIDTAAHEAAIEAGGVTIAVLPGAIDAWVPARNAALFRQIRATGALVSIVDRGQRPRFLARNGVIAALADHVVVTAAPIDSGARNTAAHARGLGRKLWVVPGSPWDPTMAGCALELTIGGADVLLAPEQLLRHLHGAAVPSPRRERPPSTLPLPFAPVTGEPGLRVTQALTGLTLTIDELVDRTALDARAVTATVGGLVLEGRVREGPRGSFALRAEPRARR